MTRDQLLDRIVTDPAICHGKPCVRGHRIWVSLILDLLADGMTIEQVLAQYPGLDVDDNPCLHGLRSRDDTRADRRGEERAITMTRELVPPSQVIAVLTASSESSAGVPPS